VVKQYRQEVVKIDRQRVVNLVGISNEVIKLTYESSCWSEWKTNIEGWTSNIQNWDKPQ